MLKTYALYVAQEIPQIDTEIAQKGHFRIETNKLKEWLKKENSQSVTNCHQLKMSAAGLFEKKIKRAFR